MAFNASDFWSNPIGNILSAYTDILGVFFYAGILLVVMGYVLMRTESWASASVIGILIGIIFIAVLPQIFLVFIAILAVFVLASLIIETWFL